MRKGFDKIGKVKFEIKRRRNKKCHKKMLKECAWMKVKWEACKNESSMLDNEGA